MYLSYEETVEKKSKLKYLMEIYQKGNEIRNIHSIVAYLIVIAGCNLIAGNLIKLE